MPFSEDRVLVGPGHGEVLDPGRRVRHRHEAGARRRSRLAPPRGVTPAPAQREAQLARRPGGDPDRVDLAIDPGVPTQGRGRRQQHVGAGLHAQDEAPGAHARVGDDEPGVQCHRPDRRDAGGLGRELAAAQRSGDRRRRARGSRRARAGSDGDDETQRTRMHRPTIRRTAVAGGICGAARGVRLKRCARSRARRGAACARGRGAGRGARSRCAWRASGAGRRASTTASDEGSASGAPTRGRCAARCSG